MSERRVRVSTQGGWSQIANFGHCRVGCRRTQQHQVTTSDLALSNDDECDNQVQKIVSRTETQYRGCSKLSTLLEPLEAFANRRERMLSRPGVAERDKRDVCRFSFCRTTRTSWRTVVDEDTARLVDRGATLGITVIIIFIRTIW